MLYFKITRNNIKRKNLVKVYPPTVYLSRKGIDKTPNLNKGSGERWRASFVWFGHLLRCSRAGVLQGAYLGPLLITVLTF